MITSSDHHSSYRDRYPNARHIGRDWSEINDDFITALQELIDTHRGRIKGATRKGATMGDRVRGAAAIAETLIPGLPAAEIGFNTVFPRDNADAPKANRFVGDTVRSILNNPFR